MAGRISLKQGTRVVTSRRSSTTKKGKDVSKRFMFYLSAIIMALILVASNSPAQAHQSIAKLHTKQEVARVIAQPVHGTCDPSAVFCESEYEADGTSALPYWAQGWQFEGRTVCLESARALAPLDSVRYDYYSVTNGLIQFTPERTVGGCSARGYALSQQIKFYSYSSNTDGWCGYTQTWTLGGYVHHVNVYINEHPDRVGCRDAASWPSLWEHEVGHATGLAHVPATENSVMPATLNDKRVTASNDAPRIANLYTGNPLFGNGNP